MPRRISVAIIGAGPAGCTLARLLLQHQAAAAANDSAQPSHAQLDVTVFEAEAAPEFRAQGGTLDLHTSTGLAALKAAGLYHEFLAHARFDGEAFRLCDKQLKSYIRVSGGGPQAETETETEAAEPASSRGAPEIDRAQLRSMLVQALPHGTVRWGWRLETLLSEPLPSPPTDCIHKCVRVAAAKDGPGWGVIKERAVPCLCCACRMGRSTMWRCNAIIACVLNLALRIATHRASGRSYRKLGTGR